MGEPVRHRPPPNSPPPGFDWASGRRTLLRCRVCGRAGLPLGRWMTGCVRGHPWYCTCGMHYSSRQSLATHIRWKDSTLHMARAGNPRR